MSYFRFTSEYVILSGGSDLYQSEFENIADISMGQEMRKRSVYLYSAESREVYMTKLAYFQICDQFRDMYKNLIPISEPTVVKIDKTKINNSIIAPHLASIIECVKVLNVCDTMLTKRVLCCSHTGAELAIFPISQETGKTLVFPSRHKLVIMDAIERMNYLIEKKIIESSGDKDAIATISDHYKKCSDKRYSQYNIARWVMKNHIIEDCKYKYFGNLQYDNLKCLFSHMILIPTQSFAGILDRLFENEISGESPLLALEEKSIISRINEMTGENYPLANYKLNSNGLWRNGIFVTSHDSIFESIQDQFGNADNNEIPIDNDMSINPIINSIEDFLME